MANIEAWSETAASNNSASPDGWPENMSSAGLNDSGREMMAAVAKAYHAIATYGSPTPSLEWLDLSYGKTITRASDTQITVGSLDVTAWATANRRIRIVSASAQADGFVTSSSFSTNTTVNVTMDGGTVPTSPSKLFFHVGSALAKVAYTGTLDGYDSAALLPGLRNRLINGAFDIWQRGTSLTASGYCADRWKMTLGTSGSATVTRQSHTLGQTDVPGEPAYFLRWTHSVSSSSAPTLEQRIEGVRTLAGKAVVVSFYAKASSAINVVGKLTQNFGTGGSPSSENVKALGTFSLTTSWARYSAAVTLDSISGKTLGSAFNDYLSLRLEMPTGSTFTFDISDVQVEPGSVVTTFERRLLALEMSMALRFYQKTFPYATAPAQSAGTTGAIAAISSGSVVAATWTFGPALRGSPTVTTYAPDAASANWSSSGTTPTAYVQWYSTSGAALYGSGATDQTFYSIHATADAEL